MLGVSYSLHRCSELSLNKKAVLKAALNDLSFRRLRLMSYWNIHEPRAGQYTFDELDWQLDMAADYGAHVSLCIGKRQPRWPECHLPDWAAELPRDEWRGRLYAYIKVVVERYKNHPALHSWQLENEALLKDFGYCRDGDYDHKRLQREFELVKRLDPTHPVIMTLSDSWGLPFKKPRPDAYALSLYRTAVSRRKGYFISKRPALFYAARVGAIKLFKQRAVFIHELQAEPWLSDAILKSPLEEQLARMNEATLQENVRFAQKTGIFPIDLWGLEWWYWLKETQGHSDQWETVKALVHEQQQ